MQKIIINKKIFKINFIHKNSFFKKKKVKNLFFNFLSINILSLPYFFLKTTNFLYFEKKKFFVANFNINKKQLFLSFFDCFKNKNSMSISTGVFLSYLNIKIKFIKNNIKGWFLFLNFINKKLMVNNFKNVSFFFLIKGLKKKINLIFQKIIQIFNINDLFCFYFFPKIKQYTKIKKFIKRRIKKKIIKIENLYN